LTSKRAGIRKEARELSLRDAPVDRALADRAGFRAIRHWAHPHRTRLY